MDATDAADAARNYITIEISGFVPNQLALEEAAQDPTRREWRVTLTFTRPGGQQEQQSASAARSYKKIIINDTDGLVISMPDPTPCPPKSVCKVPAQDACTAGRGEQSGCVAPTPMSRRGRVHSFVRSLWDLLRSLWRRCFLYASTAMALASLITLYTTGESKSWIPLGAAALGTTIALFAEGRWGSRGRRRRSGNRKKKRGPC